MKPSWKNKKTPRKSKIKACWEMSVLRQLEVKMRSQLPKKRLKKIWLINSWAHYQKPQLGSKRPLISLKTIQKSSMNTCRKFHWARLRPSIKNLKLMLKFCQLCLKHSLSTVWKIQNQSNRQHSSYALWVRPATSTWLWCL
jgi:hypothetical protein